VRNGLKRREVTQMSKTKKLLAAALATVSLAAVPATSIALSASPSIPLACGSTSGGGGCE
jgi:hypothetical protein